MEASGRSAGGVTTVEARDRPPTVTCSAVAAARMDVFGICDSLREEDEFAACLAVLQEAVGVGGAREGQCPDAGGQAAIGE